MPPRIAHAAVVALVAPWLACSAAVPAPPPKGPKPELTPLAELCGDASLGAEDFCMPVARVEPLLRAGRGEILYHKITESGVSHPSVVHLGFDDGSGGRIVFRAKWKVAPEGGEGFNNSPYRELAAYEVQKLFLDPDEYVVPPTIGVCMPLEQHAAAMGEVPATFPDTRCVFGVMSYWLENVTPDGARDLQRADRDEPYRANLERLNMLTYLIGHRDPRDANFLVSKDPARPRVFAVDNGLAFGGFRNPFTFWYGDWGKIRVPRLPRPAVERLRALTRADLDRLAVIAQYENRDGVLTDVPAGAPLSQDDPVRVSGDVVQLGLTRQEIDALEARVHKLVEQVDAGEIGLD
jgi:hypothetical protein